MAVAFGEKWRAAREAAGLSVRQAAALAGVHHNSIYDIEKGDDGVTLRWMKNYADAIGVRLAEIFCADDDQSERVPAFMRPLVEQLSPLTTEARVSIVKNIASNLRFMWANILGTENLLGRSDGIDILQGSTSVQSVTTSPKDDGTEQGVDAMQRSTPIKEPSMGIHGPRQAAATRRGRRHGQATHRKP